jgi:hypothetical protein
MIFKVYPLFKIALLGLLWLNVPVAQAQKRLGSDSAQAINRKFVSYNIEGRKLSTREVLNRLSSVDSSAYKVFSGGHHVQKIGGSLALVGAGLNLIGVFMIVGQTYNSISSVKEADSRPGTAVLIVGGTVTAVGLGILTFGKIRKNRAVTHYNTVLAERRPQAVIYLKPALTSFTFTLRF